MNWPAETRVSSSLWTSPRVSSLAEAILYTLSYADVFDFPLTPDEIHRYLLGLSATIEDITATAAGLKGVSECQGYFTLSGRESNVSVRLHREKVAAAMWPRFVAYGRAIARLPFVRMVALTGALAVGNVEEGDDYDYLIVTTPGRVWVTRRLIIQLVVRPATRRGDEVCPNYILSEDALTLPERDLFHAHELAHMIPLFGSDVYERLRQANNWTESFLPNAIGRPVNAARLPQPSRLQRAIPERILGAVAGRWFERQEMSRLQRRISAQGDCQEVQLSPLCCKGHIGAHSHSTFRAFAARIERGESNSGASAGERCGNGASAGAKEETLLSATPTATTNNVAQATEHTC